MPGAAGATAKPGVAPREQVLAEAPRVKIRTPRLNGSIDLIGARIDDLTLVNYHETTDPKSPEIVLLAPDGTEHPYFLEFGWVASAGPRSSCPGRKRAGPPGGVLTPEQPVELKWDNGDGLAFMRRYAVDDDYHVHRPQTVENHPARPYRSIPMAVGARSGDMPVIRHLSAA